MITLSFDDLEKLKVLDRSSEDKPTCFDYVDSFVFDDNINRTGQYAVTVFVEPAGNVTRHGNSWGDILDWWIDVFKTQPANVHGHKCGWHLLDLYQKDKFPDKPADCWEGLK